MSMRTLTTPMRRTTPPLASPAAPAETPIPRLVAGILVSLLLVLVLAALAEPARAAHSDGPAAVPQPLGLLALLLFTAGILHVSLRRGRQSHHPGADRPSCE